MQSGNILEGFIVSTNKFQGVSNLNQLQAFGLARPSEAETARGGDSEMLKATREMRDEVQRRFDAQRVRRAISYRDYIHGVEHQGQMGGTPAITLWYPKQLEVSNGGIVIPYNTPLVAIDGETQTEARYMLRDGIEGRKIGRTKLTTADIRDAIPLSGETPLAVTLYHGLSIKWAQQILRDYNAEAHPINPQVAATFDNVGPLSRAVARVLEESNIPAEKVNRKGRVAGKRFLIAYNQVLFGLGGYALDGTEPAPLNPTNLRLLNRPGGKEIPRHGIDAILGIISAGILTQGEPLVWQAAGHKLAAGENNLDFHAGMKAYEDTKKDGRGGKRMSPTARLAIIVKAL